MNGPLIRTRQSPLMRMVDVIATLLVWAAFIYLVARGIAAMLSYQVPTIESRFGTMRATADTLIWYVVIAALNACVLAAWALYNQIRRQVERRSTIPALHDDQLSDSFSLTPDMLQALRSGQVIVVHNDTHGGIASVVPRGALQLEPHGVTGHPAGGGRVGSITDERN